jgi:hypothetical protein
MSYSESDCNSDDDTSDFLFDEHSHWIEPFINKKKFLVKVSVVFFEDSKNLDGFYNLIPYFDSALTSILDGFFFY